MYTIICDRCNLEFTGHDELEAERLFDAHACPDMRDLYDMPLDLLRKVAYGTLTEADAWKLADARKA